MAAKPHWFPLYVKDALADPKTARLSNEAFGIHWRLLLTYWNEACSLPARLEDLVELLPRTTLAKLRAAWPAIAPLWVAADDGSLHNRKLDEIWDEQSAKSLKATASARKRWNPEGAVDGLPLFDEGSTEKPLAAGGESDANALPPHANGRRHLAAVPDANALPSQCDGNAHARVQSRAEQSREDLQDPADPAPRRSVKTDLPWVAELKASIQELRTKTMAELTGDQRILLGRYHALLFANCTRDEGRNRTTGIRIAGGFAKMAVSERFGGLTIRRYVRMAREVFEAQKGVPLFDAWAILAIDTDYVPERRQPK